MHDKRKNRYGIALILSLVFLALFSTLAVGMVTLSSRCIQTANNQAKAARARMCAESGIDFMKYWMSRVHLSGLIAPTQRFTNLASQMQTDLQYNGIENVIVNSRLWIGYNGS